MRKFLAISCTIALMAAAFFLPAQLSQWNDRLLLDEPHILQEAEREGFAESVGLTVAEKVLLLRGGNLDSLTLGDGPLEETYTGGSMQFSFSGAAGVELEGYSEEDQSKWAERMTAVQSELRSLQILGALPIVWDAESSLEYANHSQVLYVDRDTQVSFLVYQMTLTAPPYSLGLAVDAQSGRVLSFSLYWSRDGSLNWGARGSSNFGGAWRDYWGLDSVNASWYNDYTRGILEAAEARMRVDGEYNAVVDISFNYNGQSVHIPLLCWAYSTDRFSIHWNP